jgi:arylsulfatase A-like enzyme
VKALAAADEMMVGVLDHLDSEGVLANTVFVLISDNGYSHGEHFSKGKGDEYDPSVRTAFAIASKNFVPSNAKRSEIAANIDIAPTLGELAGLAPIAAVEGVSLVPLLSPGGTVSRTDLLLERWSKNPSGGGTPANPIPTWNAVVARRGSRLWKYVELAAGTTNTELYDLSGDEFELVNLVTRPEHAALVAELSARIQALKGA